MLVRANTSCAQEQEEQQPGGRVGAMVPQLLCLRPPTHTCTPAPQHTHTQSIPNPTLPHVHPPSHPALGFGFMHACMHRPLRPCSVLPGPSCTSLALQGLHRACMGPPPEPAPPPPAPPPPLTGLSTSMVLSACTSCRSAAAASLEAATSYSSCELWASSSVAHDRKQDKQCRRSTCVPASTACRGATGMCLLSKKVRGYPTQSCKCASVVRRAAVPLGAAAAAGRAGRAVYSTRRRHVPLAHPCTCLPRAGAAPPRSRASSAAPPRRVRPWPAPAARGVPRPAPHAAASRAARCSPCGPAR